MALGVASQQLDLLDPVSRFCAERLPANSIFAFMAGQREVLFPDVMFADLFADIGRRSVPPSVVAAVMVLQRLEGLSDREATDRFTFDVRWRYAAGVGGWDSPAHRVSFVHTVLADMRERLRGGAADDVAAGSAAAAMQRLAAVAGRGDGAAAYALAKLRADTTALLDHPALVVRACASLSPSTRGDTRAVAALEEALRHTLDNDDWLDPPLQLTPRRVGLAHPTPIRMTGGQLPRHTLGSLLLSTAATAGR
jgi:hypothetical protein